jgi:hypothetical protein
MYMLQALDKIDILFERTERQIILILIGKKHLPNTYICHKLKPKKEI